jgi:hypothetical protein
MSSSSAVSSPAPIEDQAKLLDEILNVVKVQSHLMKKCLVKYFIIIYAHFIQTSGVC